MIFQNGISRYGHKPLTFHGAGESRVAKQETISRRRLIISESDGRCFAKPGAVTPHSIFPAAATAEINHPGAKNSLCLRGLHHSLYTPAKAQNNALPAR